jgi:uncharacterized 2Fe-2S/4Fe-4S cluster protein (DUF4445 family)
MTDDTVRITLQPIGVAFDVPRGAPLRDILFEHGVDFPCGGRGTCKGCRVRVLSGHLATTATQELRLSREELAKGWRLACRCTAEADLSLELAQWEMTVLADETPFPFVPREGLGVAVDVGTTTLAAQIVDLETTRVLGTRTSLNPQAAHGADLMSRVGYALSENGGDRLRALVRDRIRDMVGELRAAAPAGRTIVDVVLVGNTVMHHLFCGFDLEPLSHSPFEPADDGLKEFRAGELGWTSAGEATVRFLPCLGGFVGSDILAGLLAVGMAESERLIGLVDLGTNGETVFGNRRRILCASTAAGPAFEGAGIGMGMRAATGAIVEAEARDGGIVCRVLGSGRPRGICGSGLVDVAAAGLELGWIDRTGRIADGTGEIALAPAVGLAQNDVRQLQLAKGAIAAGIQLLLAGLGVSADDVSALYLAGAFGNYINRTSARRIGLLDFPEEKVVPAGNTALLGAKLALCNDPAANARYPLLRSRVEHVPLNLDPQFQDVFVENMSFPEGSTRDPS